LRRQGTVRNPDSDRETAAKLGRDLYNLLTRPLNDSLASGASIPVRSAVDKNQVNAHLGKTVVVIPVLGATAFFLRRKSIIKQLTDWHKQLGDGCVLLVPTCSQWRWIMGTLAIERVFRQFGSVKSSETRFVGVPKHAHWS